MQGRAFKREFLDQCPLGERDKFYAWATNNRLKGFRTQRWADLRAGRPVGPQYIAMVLRYFIDISRTKGLAAANFVQVLQDKGMSVKSITIDDCLQEFTEVRDFYSPLEEGMDAIKNLFDLCRDPLEGIRPCESASEVMEVTRWLFVEGGRRAAGKRLGEKEAIEAAQAFVRTSLHEYSMRLVRWWKQEPWCVAVGGDNMNSPRVMSIAAPVSDERYSLIRSGTVDMFRADVESHQHRSPNIFMESLATRPTSWKTWSLTPKLAHVFRTVLTQQAVLSDVPKLGEEVPLRIISIGAASEMCKWLRRFKYRPLESRTPETDLPLWERQLWDDAVGIRERAHWGVWRAIQRYFRTAPVS